MNYHSYTTLIQRVLLSLVLLLQACVSVPASIQPVARFDLNRYLGVWYEIARIDNRFEHGLEQVTATYTQRKDGLIQVENSGIKSKNGKRKTALGKAKAIKDPTIGHLEVSFFGPFYGSYIVFHLEEDYSVALVCGSNKGYCWILARKPVLSQQELAKYHQILQEKGFDLKKFIYPPNQVVVHVHAYTKELDRNSLLQLSKTTHLV
jgi:apolipoprotein D and lipocalin family protein